MTRTETCLEAGVRMTAGVLVAAVGHVAGDTASGLLPPIGPLIYLLGVVPATIVGFYAFSTGLWVVVRGATDQAIERAVSRTDLTGDMVGATGDAADEPTEDDD
ncbi:MAG: hypothetical protein ABEH47_06595 [Haloferacaceae archaeon]